MRDEKWRFDPKTGAAVVSRRNGFREMDNFHLVDATLDALGSFTKSYHMKNEKDFIKDRVKEPHTHNDADSVRNEDVKQSNAFSGVSINTQYSTQNGYPRKLVFIVDKQPTKVTISHFPDVSNVVGIQQLNAPNLFNGLNFQQAFTTPGFGFQQQGSLFNHQSHFTTNPLTFANNHNFQLSSFLMPFFNQPNNKPDQHHTFPPFGTAGVDENGGSQMGQVTEQQHAISTTPPTTNTPSLTGFPFTTKATQRPVPQSTLKPIVNVETTQDPTLNFDIRFEESVTMETNGTETQNISTTSRRPIEGLPSSDEDDDDDEGPLGDRINNQVLKTLVG